MRASTHHAQLLCKQAGVWSLLLHSPCRLPPTPPSHCRAFHLINSTVDPCTLPAPQPRPSSKLLCKLKEGDTPLRAFLWLLTSLRMNTELYTVSRAVYYLCPHLLMLQLYLLQIPASPWLCLGHSQQGLCACPFRAFDHTASYHATAPAPPPTPFHHLLPHIQHQLQAVLRSYLLT